MLKKYFLSGGIWGLAGDESAVNRFFFLCVYKHKVFSWPLDTGRANSPCRISAGPPLGGGALLTDSLAVQGFNQQDTCFLSSEDYINSTEGGQHEGGGKIWGSIFWGQKSLCMSGNSRPEVGVSCADVFSVMFNILLNSMWLWEKTAKVFTTS